MTNYIISCYFGKRRSELYNNYTINDRFCVVKKHLEILNELNLQDLIVSLSINKENDDVDDKSLISNIDISFYPNLKFNSILVRENKDYSYGAWNAYLIKSITHKEQYENVFIIEDDYVPVDKDFINIFKCKINHVNKFICQQVFNDNPQRHCAISNGLLDYDTAKDIYKKTGTVFCLHGATDYGNAEMNQVNFTKYLQDAGYDFSDVSDITHNLFLSINDIRHYGNFNEKTIIKPICTL